MEYICKVDRFEFIIKVKETEIEGSFFCHIPAYDMVYGSKKDDIEIKGITMVKSFINYYNIK